MMRSLILQKTKKKKRKFINIYLKGIHQTESFTKIWYTLKTVTFPIVLVGLIWFCRQMKRAQKKFTNLDK